MVLGYNIRRVAHTGTIHSSEMCTHYDEKRKVWGNLDAKAFSNQEIPLGREILDLLAQFGPQLAQVFQSCEN